jgi:outer membrane protein TolC
LTTPIAYSPQDYAEAALVRTALTNSTDLARFNLDLEDANAARTIAYSSARPDLIASVGVNDAGQTLGGQTYSTGWFGGLRVEVPLRDRALAEDKQRVDRDTAVLEQRITAARDSVAQQVQRLVRAADSVKASIAIGEEALALARKNREQAQGMYDEGLSDYLRVLDADDRLVEAERSLLQQQVQYLLNAVRIRQALGEDIAQDLPG